MKVEARNGLEGMAYNFKNTVNDAETGAKLSEDDKKTILTKVEDTIKWLDEHQDEDKAVCFQDL